MSPLPRDFNNKGIKDPLLDNYTWTTHSVGGHGLPTIVYEHSLASSYNFTTPKAYCYHVNIYSIRFQPSIQIRRLIRTSSLAV